MAKKKITAKKAPAPPSSGVDPQMKKQYDALLAEVTDADRDEKHGWDRKYEAVGEILEKKLFLLSPHGTAQKWCAANLAGENYRTVLRNVRLARYCSPEDEHDHGTAKLDALLTYLEASGAKPASRSRSTRCGCR